VLSNHLSRRDAGLKMLCIYELGSASPTVRAQRLAICRNDGANYCKQQKTTIALFQLDVPTMGAFSAYY
jgi:hypothetical protein